MYLQFVYCFAVLAIYFITLQAHPQCMDTSPPFKLKSKKEVFCQRYEQSGCCSIDENNALKAKYNKIILQLSKEIIKTCKVFIKDILCQTCSPYAAHVFEIHPTFPDLCPKYCNKFYDKCRETLQYITNNKQILKSLETKKQFCETINLKHSPYCWPNVHSNTSLITDFVRQSSLGCLCLKPFASEMYNPVRLKSPNDGSGRVFVLEQRGFIWIFNKNGTKTTKPFLDIREKLKVVNLVGSELGLVGFTFHPEFKENRKIYIHYTKEVIEPGFKSLSVISEVRVSEDDGNRVDMSSERVILEVQQPTLIHKAGELLFGLDGFLYIFLGDGGPNYDKHNQGQNRSTLLGSVLRVDVSDLSVPYTVPSDNPFVGLNNIRPEIWAYGFRNPWRGDIDEGDPLTGYGRGRIIFGDVGQALVEEVNILHRGGNYGWRALEGFKCAAIYPGINQTECDNTVDDIKPIAGYNHFPYGNAIVPGHMYRGCELPALTGTYVFGFHMHSRRGGRMFSLKESAPNSYTWNTTEIKLCGSDICHSGLTNKHGSHIMGFGKDDEGEMYVMTSDTSLLSESSGMIFKLVDPIRRDDRTHCSGSMSTDSSLCKLCK